MSRNRMKNSQSLHWMGVVKWVLIAGLLSILGLSYMLCKNQNLHLAQETFRLNEQCKSIEKRNAQLRYDLDTMMSPVRLANRLMRMHSTLVRLSDMGQMVVNMDMRVRARLMPTGTVPEGNAVPPGSEYNADSVASFGSSTLETSPARPSP